MSGCSSGGVAECELNLTGVPTRTASGYTTGFPIRVALYPHHVAKAVLFTAMPVTVTISSSASARRRRMASASAAVSLNSYLSCVRTRFFSGSDELETGASLYANRHRVISSTATIVAPELADRFISHTSYFDSTSVDPPRQTFARPWKQKVFAHGVVKRDLYRPISLREFNHPYHHRHFVRAA